jgi:small-conductance mechanosensitive channel
MTRSWLSALLALCSFMLLQAAYAQVEPPPSPAQETAPAQSADRAPPAAQPAPQPAAAASSQPAAKPRASSAVLNVGLGTAPDVVRRETPRDTVTGFVEAARHQEYARAAHYLNLSKLPLAEQRRLGPQLAQQLYEVLDNQVWFDLDVISNDPLGGFDKPEAIRELQVATVPIKGGTQGIRLVRVAELSGRQAWVFSSSTVDAIRDLHARYGPPAFLERVPSWMQGRAVLGLELWQWFGLMLLVVACWGLGLVLQKLAGLLLRLVGRRTGEALSTTVTRRLEGPIGLVAGLLALLVLLPVLRTSATAQLLLTRIIYIGIILAVTRGVVGLINHGAMLIEVHSSKAVEEELKRRAIATQVSTLRRIAVVLVVLVGVALALMQFPVVRTVGWSLLGSAGIAGAILGFAAQKTFSNVFAGIVISITQPIRIGDTVVVEKEWGRIEEIGATHVVVKIWDLRRLVLPIVYFLEQPFENWTRTEAELVGTVRVHADYRVAVQEARQALQDMLKDEPLWNGKTCGLIVEDLQAESVLLRIALSADDSGKLWDLRCKVREQMLAFLQASAGRIPVRRVENPAQPVGTVAKS